MGRGVIGKKSLKSYDEYAKAYEKLHKNIKFEMKLNWLTNSEYSFVDYINWVFYGRYPNNFFSEGVCEKDVKRIRDPYAIRQRCKDIYSKGRNLFTEQDNSDNGNTDHSGTINNNIFPENLSVDKKTGKDPVYSIKFTFSNRSDENEAKCASAAFTKVLSNLVNHANLSDKQIKKYSENNSNVDNEYRKIEPFYKEIIREFNKLAKEHNVKKIAIEGPKGIDKRNAFIKQYHDQMIDNIGKLQTELSVKYDAINNFAKVRKTEQTNEDKNNEMGSDNSNINTYNVVRKGFWENGNNLLLNNIKLSLDTKEPPYYLKEIAKSFINKLNEQQEPETVSDDNTKITFSILKESNNKKSKGFVYGETITASLAEIKSSKYSKTVSEAKGCYIIGVKKNYNGTYSQSSLTKEIVDTFTSVETIVVGDSVKSINNDAFNNNKLQEVVFIANENNVQSDGNYNINIISNTTNNTNNNIINNNNNFQILVGCLQNNSIQYNNYNVTQFNTLYNANQVKNCNKGNIYTFKTESVIPKKDNDTTQDEKNRKDNITKSKGKSSKSKASKEIDLPESMFGKNRSFWSKVGRWFGKFADWVTIGLAACVVIPIIAVGVAGGNVLAVAVGAGFGLCVGKQIAKIVSKKYHGIFLEDKAVKIARKYRDNLLLLKHNADRQVTLLNTYNSETNNNVELKKVSTISLENDKIQKRLGKLANKYETISDKSAKNYIKRKNNDNEKNSLYSLMSKANNITNAYVKQVDDIFNKNSSKNAENGSKNAENVVSKVLHSKKKRMEKLQEYMKQNSSNKKLTKQAETLNKINIGQDIVDNNKDNEKGNEGK